RPNPSACPVVPDSTPVLGKRRVTRARPTLGKRKGPGGAGRAGGATAFQGQGRVRSRTSPVVDRIVRRCSAEARQKSLWGKLATIRRPPWLRLSPRYWELGLPCQWRRRSEER